MTHIDSQCLVLKTIVLISFNCYMTHLGVI